MQSHGVLRMRCGILLALHEGGFRFTLFKPQRLHVLGQEAVVAQEEAAVAAGHAGGRAAGHRRGGGRGAARAARGPAAVGRPPRAPPPAQGQARQAQGRRRRRGRSRVGGVPPGGGSGSGHRRSHPSVLRVRRGAGVSVPRGRMRGWGPLAARPPLRRRPPSATRPPRARGRRLQKARAQHRRRVAIGGFAGAGGEGRVAGGVGGLAGRARGALAGGAQARSAGRCCRRGRHGRHGGRRQRVGRLVAGRPAVDIVTLAAPAHALPVRIYATARAGPRGRHLVPTSGPTDTGRPPPHRRLRDPPTLRSGRLLADRPH